MGYKDPDDLRRLYHDEGMTQAEIADHYGVNPGSVHYHMDKHGIERRDRMAETNKTRRKGARVATDGNGYEHFRESRNTSVQLHRLIAIAKFGYDAVVDNEVHHVSGVPWDNRLSNITIMAPGDHQRLHVEEQPRGPGGKWT